MLDETMIVVLGEFGRTVGGLTGAGGRDHLTRMCIALAGGGVRGGTIIGKTDPTGATVAEYGWSANRDVRPEDLTSTIYSALGIDCTTVRRDDPLGRGFEYVPLAKDGTYSPSMSCFEVLLTVALVAPRERGHRRRRWRRLCCPSSRHRQRDEPHVAAVVAVELVDVRADLAQLVGAPGEGEVHAAEVDAGAVGAALRVVQERADRFVGLGGALGGVAEVPFRAGGEAVAEAGAQRFRVFEVEREVHVLDDQLAHVAPRGVIDVDLEHERIDRAPRHAAGGPRREQADRVAAGERERPVGEGTIEQPRVPAGRRLSIVRERAAGARRRERRGAIDDAAADAEARGDAIGGDAGEDRKSTRLNSS